MLLRIVYKHSGNNSFQTALSGERVKRILLVEDHQSFSESFEMLLEQEPDLHVVGRTSSTSECHEFVSRGERFDLAIVDLFLPEGTALDLIRELRECSPQSSLLVLTISLDPEDRRRALEAGADEVLSKASSLDEILETIKSTG